MNPLGFSPALLRGGDGRLGRLLDPILLYYQSYHSWTRVSVTAVTFTARSVHSRAADPDTLHFQGSPRLEQGLCRSASCQPVARPSTATAPTRYSRREAWLRSDVIRALLARAVPCFPAVLYIYRFLSVRLPWWRWVQLSRVSSLTASRSSFDCLASSREAHASAAEAAGRQPADRRILGAAEDCRP